MRETVQIGQENIEDGGRTVTPCESLPALMREVITGGDHVNRCKAEIAEDQWISKTEEKSYEIILVDWDHGRYSLSDEPVSKNPILTEPR
jgi:hypothetical protein